MHVPTSPSGEGADLTSSASWSGSVSDGFSCLDSSSFLLDVNAPARHIKAEYPSCCSYTHNVASKGKYIAFLTTEAKTDNPEVELKTGIDLLGPVDEIFFGTYDRFVPTNNHDVDNCFIFMGKR
ncbi:unnamed protein product [Camellia sinensis]